MLYPATRVVPLRIMVRPVHHTAFRVPFKFAIKADRITRSQRIDARRQVDVVCDEQRLSGIQPNNEALMAAAIVVVGQELHYHALAGKLPFAVTIGEGIFEGGVGVATGS